MTGLERGPLVYNPAELGRDELIDGFVVRNKLLDQLLELLRDSSEGAPPHALLVGRRGMGKTTLLRRLACAIEDDPALSSRWVALTFPEEQHDVRSLAALWTNCLDALGDALERAGRRAEAAALDRLIDALPAGPQDDERRDAARLALERWTEEHDRGLCLLLDNADLILDAIVKAEEDWALREALGSGKRILMIGATASPYEPAHTYDGAFYDFFATRELGRLDQDEARTLLVDLAERYEAARVREVLRTNPGRIRTLFTLTGGNPRTLVLLFTILARATGATAEVDLERLLDIATPLYQDRMRNLPAQAASVFQALALHWDPARAQDVAEASGLAVNAVSSQLARLTKLGLVEKVTLGEDEKRTGFQVAERFFNIWFLMRYASRRRRRRLAWLVRFLELFYGPDRLEVEAWRLVDEGLPAERGRRGYVCSLAYAFADRVRHAPLQGKLVELAESAEEVDRSEDASRARELFAEGWVLLQRGKTAEAAGLFQQGLALDPENAAGWEGLGWLVYECGRYEESERAYRKAIGLDPALQTAWHNLGLTCSRLGKFQEAEHAYRMAIEFDPDYALSWDNLGFALERQGKFEDSEEAFLKAVDLDAGSAQTWFGLGLARGLQDKFQEAEQALRKSIEIQPDSAQTWVAFGDALRRQCRFQESERAFRKGVELNPDISHAWLGLGLSLKRQGKLQEAVGAERKAIEILPENLFAHNNLAWSLLQLAKPIEALSFAERACTGESVPEHLHTYATILAVLGNADDSLKATQKLLDTLPPAPREGILLNDIIDLFTRLTALGRAEDLLHFLEKTDLAEPWRPLTEALRAFTEGEDRLAKVAPEVRGPALEILAQFRAGPRPIARADPTQ